MEQVGIESMLSWVESNGGPLLLVSEELAMQWYGIDPPPLSAEAHNSPGEPDAKTDYERACEITEYVGNIEIGFGLGVVLGDEPLSTAWRPSPNSNGGVLVRCRYVESESDEERLLDTVPELPFELTSVELAVPTGRVALFDSAYRGTEFEIGRSGLWLTLPAGRYRVGVSEWQPQKDAAFLLHHLVGVA